MPATGWNQGAAEATLFQLLNGARVNNGRNAVQQHSTLVSLARWRSKDLVDRNYFNHTILGTGYQVYHWYDTQRAELPLGRREHRLEQRLQRRRFAGRRPPRLHGLAGAPREHPGAGLHARRRGRIRQGQRELPGLAAQPALLHRAVHGIRLGSATASTFGGRRRWWQPQPPRPAAAAEAAAEGRQPARRATTTRPGLRPSRCTSMRRRLREPHRRWTAARWSPPHRAVPRPRRCGRWPSPATPQARRAAWWHGPRVASGSRRRPAGTRRVRDRPRLADRLRLRLAVASATARATHPSDAAMTVILEARDLVKRYPVGDGPGRRPPRGEPLRSIAVSSWPSWARPDQASRRSSTCLAGWTSRAAARS